MAVLSTPIWILLLGLALISPLVRKSVHENHNIYDGHLHSQGLLGSHFGVPSIPASFDYVIVGGGTSGLTIARRLAESHSVAVIEAGSLYDLDNGNLTDIPAFASFFAGKNPLFQNPLIDWRQKTTPQAGLDGASISYPQGRTLGGSSARNFMWYQRGSAGSYQKWADEVDDQSYSFPNFLPYFKKSVKFSPLEEGVRSANTTPRYDASVFSDTGGPLQVSFPSFVSPAASWFSLGLEAMGLHHISGGMQDGKLFGWSWIANTIDPHTQTRSTAASSFLRETFRKTTNLLVYRSTLAKRIIFDKDKKATGVVVESGGIGSGSITYTLSAKKEVIVASGGFRSSQLLMVSGIGPAQTLQSNGIESVIDRPGVGQGLWDHVFFCVSYEVKTVTHSALGDPKFAMRARDEYVKSRTGFLTNTGGDLLAFENVPEGSIPSSTRADIDRTFGLDWPDIEVVSLDAYIGTSHDFLLAAPDNKNYTSLCVAPVAPFSRGNVTISSDDTNFHPVVNPNWLTDPRDQQVAIAGFRRAREIFNSQAIKPLRVGKEAYPGEEIQTDDQILGYIRQSATTLHHVSCTNRMGKRDDPMAVVDSRGRVIGVDDLRVVDISIFPLLPPGQPQATVYALAEKIADDILQSQ